MTLEQATELLSTLDNIIIKSNDYNLPTGEKEIIDRNLLSIRAIILRNSFIIR